jgi:hypothetical protein
MLFLRKLEQLFPPPSFTDARQRCGFARQPIVHQVPDEPPVPRVIRVQLVTRDKGRWRFTRSDKKRARDYLRKRMDVVC